MSPRPLGHGSGPEEEVTLVARRLDARLLVPVVVAWPLVAFVALLVPLWLVWVGAVGAGVGAGASRRRRLAALTLAVVALLLLAAAGHRTLRDIGPVDELAEQHAVVAVKGQLASEPIFARAGGSGGAAGGSASGMETPRAKPMVLVRLDVAEVMGRGQRAEVKTPVLALGDAEWAELTWHQDVEVTVRLSPADPGDDVVALARPRGHPKVVEQPGPLFRAADSVRADFREATAHLPPDPRGLVPALVIGDTSLTPPELTQAMLDTGMSHLSAVSGSNVTLVLAAAMGLGRLVGARRAQRPWMALAVLACFVVLARPEPSVIRAAVMGTVGLLALSTSRRQAGVPALSGAVVVLLAWDPWLSRSYGFALSSVATLGLLLFAQPWGRAIARALPGRLHGLGPILAVPVAAQAVCAPIVVPLQGTVSFIAVAANLLAAPLVAPTTIVGVSVALLAVVWASGASWLAWGAGLPAQGIAWVARSCARAPFGSIDWGDSAAAALALALLTAGAIVLGPWVWHRSRLKPLLALSAVAVTTAFVTPTSPLAWPPPRWVLVACDVGQGDGLVINNGVRDGVGHGIVVDTGTEASVIDGCLDRLGIEVVDLVVLTHFHADHVEGLAGVADGRRVNEIRVSPVKDPPAEVHRVKEVAARAGIPVRELRAGDGVTVGQFRADVWWPARQISEGSVPNNGSVVMTVHVGGVSILMAGDMEREAAAQVLRESQSEPALWGDVDVLKVAHHGSSNRDDRLLDHITGRLAIISVGKDNDYGHPAPSLLEALRSRGFDVHRTDLEGDLAVVERSTGVTVVGLG